MKKISEERFTEVHVLDNNIINDPVFDLVPGKHGHFLDNDGKIQEVNGIRMRVPFLDVNPKTMFQIADFLDNMDGTYMHPNVTVITKEANKVYNIPAKIGVFAI